MAPHTPSQTPHRAAKRGYDIHAVIVLLATAFLASAAGVLGLFDRIGWFDKGAHFYVSFTIAAALMCAAPPPASPGRTLRRYAGAIFALTLAVGLCWEAGEWIVDRVGHRGLIEGRADTLRDVAADALGALAAIMLGLNNATRNGTKPTGLVPYRMDDARSGNARRR